jgi:hypothetical protein
LWQRKGSWPFFVNFRGKGKGREEKIGGKGVERGGRKGKREGKLKQRLEEGEEGRGALARQKGREWGRSG